MAKVKIVDTILRDAHQSLAATRMTTEQMLPALENLDKVGYYALECWGGATFDSCIRFLNEDPWERLRTIRKHCPNTKLQMLLRGQNLLGYKHYADDLVEYFVAKAIENGMDIFRIFDALNDLRNIETAMKATKKYGGHAQGCISYTLSPFHSIDKFVEDAKRLESMGADSVCIKDMAGLLLPYTAYELVKSLKAALSIPVDLHTHYTSGTASMVLLKAIEAGVDIVDTALSPLALGTSQAPTETLVASLQNTEYDTGLDLELLTDISKHFDGIRKEWLASGRISPKVLGVDVNTLKYQVPGGMLSNLVSQLQEARQEEKLLDVLQEVPRVRADFGYPPLVTPSSQIVGTQAVLNVLMGERYKMVTKESKGILKGQYGATPAPIDDDLRAKLLKDEKDDVITCRPADLIEPELEEMKKVSAKWREKDEDVLTYAMFPQVAEKYFIWRQARDHQVENTIGDSSQAIQPA